MGGHNKPFVRPLSVNNKRGVISAKVELDVETAGRVQRREMTVQDGDLLELTTNRAIYHDCRVGEIRVEKGNEFMELRVPGSEHFLRIGQAFGDVDALAVQREMIRRTIKEHLDKEKRLRPQGIKVLSLFFIDVVEKYRKYNAEGNPIKSDYALIFAEEYQRWAKHPDYQTLFHEVDLSATVEQVHDGYFSIDRKDGIKYQRLGDDCYYAQELFEQKELTGYLKNMLTDMQKSVFEHVVYDSNTEANFAVQLENNEAVKVYAKLPGWFKVPTPLGTYNLDWAVLVELDGTERLYFVVETKSSLLIDDLRERENAKITCGQAHFNALESGDNPARFRKASTVEDLLI